MIPIVFWASLLPWLNAIHAAESTWRRRKTRLSLAGCARRKTLKMSAISSSPTVKPMIGDATSGRSTLPTMPSTCHAPNPAEMKAAPSSPPISAWLDDDGIPRRQVSRFQMMAPTSAAAITDCDSTFVSMSPDPTVRATAVPVSAPKKFATALIAIAQLGFRARVLTLVAMALAVSWKPLM